MSLLDCYGQNRAIRQLVQAQKGRRLPHSYIFYGPEGVGKSLLARAWARLMLCSGPVHRMLNESTGNGATAEEIDDSCDQCSECRQVQAGVHPDLHIINRDLGNYTEKKRERKLLTLPRDVVREFIIEPAAMRPARGRARIFIIEDAHTIIWQGQNALLKILEEPPDDTYLVLVTYRKDMLLQTVRSRCRQVEFGTLGREFIYKRLLEAGVPDEQGLYWAEFCDGSLGVAMELAKVEGFYATACELMGKMAELSYESALDLAEWLTGQGKEFSESYLQQNPDYSASDASRLGYSNILKVIAHGFDAALRHSAGEAPAAGPENFDVIERLADRYDAYGCSQVINAANTAQSRLTANVNPALIFETVLLECIDYAATTR